MSSPSIVIGSGFSGLAAAAHLAKAGKEVVVLEKNSSIGGRARKFSASGFTYDMGPSWYWMPDVFERFFAEFGKKPSDYYNLVRLDPSYAVYFPDGKKVDLPASKSALLDLFDSIEPGSGSKLAQFLKEAAFKYDVGVNEMVYKPSLSITEFMNWRLAKGVFQLHVFDSISNYIRKHFTNPKLIQLLEFPVLFLGAMPQETPAMYSLMNYADMELGTWYPMGGMFKIIEALRDLCLELGVKINTNAEVTSVNTQNNCVTEVVTQHKTYEAEAVIVSGDYHYFEQHVLAEPYRRYTEKYWDERKLAPSSLLFYLGFDKRLKNLEHHTLFFDTDFNLHAKEIYQEPNWPDAPLFYLNVPSVTDRSLAPEGGEAAMALIPLAPGLEETPGLRKKYLDIVLSRIEKLTGQHVRANLVYERSYAHRDFMRDYHAFKGNAYGLANTLNQTAILKPSIKSKLKNLMFAGQLTVPGPGVPPSLISGKVVAEQLLQVI